MSDYSQDTSRDRHITDEPRPAGGNRTGLYVGIGAVALVVILGLMSLGGGGQDVIAPTDIPEGEPVGIPETVVPADPGPILE